MKINTLYIKIKMQINKIECEYESPKEYLHSKPFFFCTTCEQILCYKCYPFHLANDSEKHNDNSVYALDNYDILYESIESNIETIKKKIEGDQNINGFIKNIESIIENINNETDHFIRKINTFKNKMIESIMNKKNIFNFNSKIKEINERLKKITLDNISKKKLISIFNDKNTLKKIGNEISNQTLFKSQTMYLNDLKANYLSTIKKIENYFEEQIKDLNVNILSKNNSEQKEKKILGNKNMNHNQREGNTVGSPIKRQKTEEPKKDNFLSPRSVKKKENKIIIDLTNENILKKYNYTNNIPKYFFSVITTANSLGKIIVYNSLEKNIKMYQIEENYFKNEKYLNFPFPHCKGVNAKNAFYLTGGTLNSLEQKLTFKITFNEQLKRPEIENFTSMNNGRKNHNILFIESKNIIVVCSGSNNLTCETININNPKHWDLLPNLNSVRMNGTLFYIKDKYIYLIGGFDTKSFCYNNGYELLEINENNKNWVFYNSNIDIKVSTMGVINLYDKLILFGGFKGGESYEKNSIEVNFENNQIKIVKENKNVLEKGIILYHSQMLQSFGKKFIGFDNLGKLVKFDIDSEKINIYDKHLKNN